MAGLGRKSRITLLSSRHGRIPSKACSRPLFPVHPGQDRRGAAEPRHGLGRRPGRASSGSRPMRSASSWSSSSATAWSRSTPCGAARPSRRTSSRSRQSRHALPAGIRPDAQRGAARGHGAVRRAGVEQIFDGIAKPAVERAQQKVTARIPRARSPSSHKCCASAASWPKTVDRRRVRVARAQLSVRRRRDRTPGSVLGDPSRSRRDARR